MTPRRPRLLFVSPVFLFPNDAGGKIRTTNILRGLKGSSAADRFEITLACPASEPDRQRWRAELQSVCDHLVHWQPPPARRRWQRAHHLLSRLPINVAGDRLPSAKAVLEEAAARRNHDLWVLDFVHSTVLRPGRLAVPHLCFTHNVEAEIFARHAQVAADLPHRWLWRGQWRKMERFEREALNSYDGVIAVSERDALQFRERYGVREVAAIPTGVDLDFFAWSALAPLAAGVAPVVVFTGSMDWAANVEGVRHFVHHVWPLVRRQRPDARFRVVGRHPPADLLALATEGSGIEFTGFVDDVRPHVRGAQVFVIPLQVGGGTRIKAFEAMAMGCPVVSTRLGVEGLGVTPELDHLQADAPAPFAQAILRLIEDAGLAQRLAAQARRLVEARHGHRAVAARFEEICRRALPPGFEPS